MSKIDIINAHITDRDNLAYYKGYCKKLYNGRYLADDLFQELYECLYKISEERILRYHNLNRMRYLGTKELRTFFNRRGKKKTQRAESSPLFEVCNLCETNFNFESLEVEGFDYIKEERIQKAEQKISDMKQSKEWFDAEVLLLSVDQSLSQLSRDTGIKRLYLSQACNRAKVEIRRYIE